MNKCLVIALLIIGTWCFTRVESQCREQVVSQFGAVYTRAVRIGEDDYEDFDNGTLVYDGIGHRVHITTSDYSMTRRLKEEFICADSEMGYKSVAVLLDGTCKVRKGYFFELEVPKVDEFKGEVVIGGGSEIMEESIYFGYDQRERNEFILTTMKCGPVKIVVSLADRNFHMEYSFYDLTASIPVDAFVIKCNGQQNMECGASFF
ncbi:hypothetical protein LOD99_307 [Oopsacas minuta]|uniref:Uncharacterized protein n=1 Tax=Oopsacas minuta TaxID=111878 RepID=A0AAV7KA95_9METZ|nr:hypothetical protein LOD99_307 [Oopsacas minuta]